MTKAVLKDGVAFVNVKDVLNNIMAAIKRDAAGHSDAVYGTVTNGEIFFSHIYKADGSIFKLPSEGHCSVEKLLTSNEPEPTPNPIPEPTPSERLYLIEFFSDGSLYINGVLYS